MKEINILEIINNLKLTEALAKSFATKSGIDEDKIKLFLDEKIKQRIDKIGESFSSGDMKPEEFSRATMYGKRSIFEKRLNEGYNEATFGAGKDYIENEKIVNLFAFYHPNGKIATYECHKFMAVDDCHTMRRPPFEKEYSKKEFQEHIEKYKVQMSRKGSLVDIVNSWEE